LHRKIDETPETAIQGDIKTGDGIRAKKSSEEVMTNLRKGDMLICHDLRSSPHWWIGIVYEIKGDKFELRWSGWHNELDLRMIKYPERCPKGSHLYPLVFEEIRERTNPNLHIYKYKKGIGLKTQLEAIKTAERL